MSRLDRAFLFELISKTNDDAAASGKKSYEPDIHLTEMQLYSERGFESFAPISTTLGAVTAVMAGLSGSSTVLCFSSLIDKALVSTSNF
jgi:hypothetical protein